MAKVTQKHKGTANLRPWQPGMSGNPGGKAVGAKNRLQGSFLNALADDFEENGAAAIKSCRENDPSAYVRAIVALMPKELEITKPLDGLSDDELNAALLAVRSILAAQGAGSGSGKAKGAQPAAGVSPVPQAG